LDEKVEIKNYKRKIIKKIFDLIQKDKTTPTEYAKMKDEFSAELLKQKKFEEGKEEGKKEEKIEIAKNLLDILDNKTIAIKTGLTIMEVEELRD